MIPNVNDTLSSIISASMVVNDFERPGLVSRRFHMDQRNWIGGRSSKFEVGPHFLEDRVRDARMFSKLF